MATRRFVSYLRVSTDRPGRSGLGLEAQRKAVADYLNGGNWKIIEEFVEVESGRMQTALPWRKHWGPAASTVRPSWSPK